MIYNCDSNDNAFYIMISIYIFDLSKSTHSIYSFDSIDISNDKNNKIHSNNECRVHACVKYQCFSWLVYSCIQYNIIEVCLKSRPTQFSKADKSLNKDESRKLLLDCLILSMSSLPPPLVQYRLTSSSREINCDHLMSCRDLILIH